MSFKSLAIILGDQLFPEHHQLDTGNTLFFMAEDEGLCTHYRYHKHKLILFLSAMRSYADRLRKSNCSLKYWELNQNNRHLSFEDKLRKTLREAPSISEIRIYAIEDQFFRERIRDFCREMKLKLVTENSPGFLTSHEEFERYLKGKKKPFMHTFYQWQRKRLHLLIDGEGNPFHGEWSFDKENRKKLPKDIFVPDLPQFSPTTRTRQVMNLVEEMFPDHPGRSENFSWATTREQALVCFEHFLTHRFQNFGPYEDALDFNRSFLFHSVLSPYINLGLITPGEVIDQCLKHSRQIEIHYPSLEGFVRQIIGWREFMRGMYHHYDLKSNFFDHQRKITHAWYEGTTGLFPLDNCIRKASRHGYCHHIERLMVLGNTMLLCRIHPDEVYRWFMEMFVDSSDWVMEPNVYGMSQFADGGVFATKPYICGSNYLRKMSNYPKGDWTKTMDGLYWSFIIDNEEFFASNPRLSMMARLVGKMSATQRKEHKQAADDFIASVTA